MKFPLLIAVAVALIVAIALAACGGLTPAQQTGLQTVAAAPTQTAVALRAAAAEIRAAPPTSQNAATAAALEKAAANVEKAAPIGDAVAQAATQPGASPVTVILDTGIKAAESGALGPQAVGYGILAGLVLRMIQAQLHKNAAKT